MSCYLAATWLLSSWCHKQEGLFVCYMVRGGVVEEQRDVAGMSGMVNLKAHAVCLTSTVCRLANYIWRCVCCTEIHPGSTVSLCTY